MLPFYLIQAQKKRGLDCCRSTFKRPSHCPTFLEQQRKAHADISKHTIHQCIDTHITYPYPVSIYRCNILRNILKVAKFLEYQNMRNKRFKIKFITPTPRISMRKFGVRLTITNVVKKSKILNSMVKFFDLRILSHLFLVKNNPLLFYYEKRRRKLLLNNYLNNSE